MIKKFMTANELRKIQKEYMQGYSDAQLNRIIDRLIEASHSFDSYIIVNEMISAENINRLTSNGYDVESQCNTQYKISW